MKKQSQLRKTEPLLGLASCLRMKDIKFSPNSQKALNKDPNYVDYNYRKKQLWGEKLQFSTEKLLENSQLQTEIILQSLKLMHPLSIHYW